MTVTIELPDGEAGQLIQEFGLRRQMQSSDIENSASERTVARVVVAILEAQRRPATPTAPASRGMRDGLVISVSRASRRMWGLSLPFHRMMMVRTDNAERIMREEILGETFSESPAQSPEPPRPGNAPVDGTTSASSTKAISNASGQPEPPQGGGNET